MPLTKVVITQPIFDQTKTYAAQDDRRAYADYASAGVVGVNDFLVTAAGGLSVSAAAGAAWAVGGSVADQGAYRVYHGAATGLTCGANSAQNRIDQIILRIMDATHDLSGSLHEANIAIAPGAAISGVTLTAPGASPMDLTVPANIDGCKAYILLAYVLVPGTSGAATVRDMRARALLGAGAMLGSTTLVGTSLPSSPSDGQEYFYVVDPTIPIIWHLKYKASALKWSVQSGEPLTSYVEGPEAPPNTSASFIPFTTPMSVTVPLNGDYIGEVGFRSAQGGGNSWGVGYMVPKFGAAVPADLDGFGGIGNGGSNAMMAKTPEKPLAGGTAVQAVWRQTVTGNAGSASFYGRWLKVYPRRIG